MSPLEQALAHEERNGVGGPWDPIALVRPELAATAERYLTQLSVSAGRSSSK